MKKIPKYQRVAMLEYVESQLGTIKWYEDQVKKIRAELKEYSKMLDISIDEDKWVVIK